MSWKVKSSIIGGISLSKAKSQDYANQAKKLCLFADELLSLSASWQHAAMVISSQSSDFNKSSSRTVWQNKTSKFAAQFYNSWLTPSICMQYSQQCKRMSEKLKNLAFLIIRANSVYEEAEWEAKEKFDQQISTLTALFPLTTIPFFAGAGLAAMKDSKNHTGLQNVGKWANSTQNIQQGTIRGLSKHMILNPITGLPIFISGVAQSKRNLQLSKKDRRISNNFLQYVKHNFNSPVPFVSGALSLFTAQFNNSKQGNTLKVNRIDHPWRKAESVLARPGRNLRETLDNLTELGSGNFPIRSPLANPDASIIAIQRFKKPDGTSSWLIIIPGTDGKAHSPFGWEQNTEVMSHTALARKQADSTRMVVEAMKRSGIKPNDPVTLVGHSQGGIVAASIASDYSKQYNIKHIVTAGSPIANHPIPKRTWVTSIEMTDELVPSLDGKQNPRRNNWVTIYGKATNVKENQQSLPPGVTRFSGRKYSKQKFDNSGIFVDDIPEEGTLTHDLHYHRAAYEDAMQLGSKSVLMQDKHFQKIIDGKLQSTTLWQGVMH